MPQLDIATYKIQVIYIVIGVMVMYVGIAKKGGIVEKIDRIVRIRKI